ncbi:MAG TPA: efflux RND transporter permease subunit, partial [Salinisphaeraceae bacterium]|nr:efflux RND transporter permease subunit [Salinisphaeraceae bacterium]
FEKLTNGYVSLTNQLLRRVLLGLAFFGVMIFATWGLSTQVASTLIPDEDQGVVFVQMNTPPGASLTRTNEVRDAVTHRAMAQFPDAIDNITAISGFDLLASSVKLSSAVSFVSLKPWGERDITADEVVKGLFAMGMGIPQGRVLAFNPPPIQGLSTTGGITGFIQNTGGASYNEIQEQVDRVVAIANQRPELQNVQTTLQSNVPRYFLDVDREKAMELGVSLPDVFATLQATFGSLYVNDFTLLGRNFQVNLQSQYDFRSKPEDLRDVFVRSQTTQDMIPISSLVDTERTTGPEVVERFNMFPSAKVMADPAPGYSTGDAIAAMEELVATELDNTYDIAWTGEAFFEKRASAAALIAIGFGMIMVLLFLAALYERISLPISVLTAVPFALFGGYLAVWMRGVEQSIYFQVGILVLIGLAAKNAILIVEFAVLERAEGKSYREAALNAARLRFRPIVMTSLAFILGVIPLAIATGASAASRQAIGTVVIGGMLAATFLATIFVPMFYEVIEKLSDWVTGRNRKQNENNDIADKPAGTGNADGTGEEQYHG